MDYTTISQFPSIDSIPENKIKSSNIVKMFGYLVLVYQANSRPAKMVLTDLTVYSDSLVSTRDLALDPEILNKVDRDSLLTITLNLLQTHKLTQNLGNVIHQEFDLRRFTSLHRYGVIVKVEFYLKNFKNFLEGMCIDVEMVSDPTRPEVAALMNRVNEKFDVKEFNESSIISQHFYPAKRKSKDILFNAPKRMTLAVTLFQLTQANLTQSTVNLTQNIKDLRFDTQQILFNLNYSSSEDERDEREGQEGQEEIEEAEEQEEIEEAEDEDSFISAITSLEHLKKMPLHEKIGQSFKLNGYLIEYQRGVNEVLFVEKTDLTLLNDSNSLILNCASAHDLNFGKKLEIQVYKQIYKVGSIDQIGYLIVS